MQSDTPKQFIELNGKPILMHTIERFTNAMPSVNIIIALAEVLQNDWKQLCNDHKFTITHTVCKGGATRFHSVKNGLELVPENCVVGVHDAARPLVSTETILNTFETAQQKGNAAPYVPISDSIRNVNGDSNAAVNRDDIVIVQTPQCFQSNLIKKAFEQDYQDGFTDDVSVLEATGTSINLVSGNTENIKITTARDLKIAQSML